MQYLLLLYCNDGCKNTHHYYAMRKHACLVMLSFTRTIKKTAVRHLPRGSLEDILSTVDIIYFLCEKATT